MRFLKIFIILTAVVLTSCSDNENAIIWTDRPEFALYGEYFNSVQNQYKVSVRYTSFPCEELYNGNGKINGSVPDIIAASWLKNSLTGVYFNTLDNLFGSKNLSRSIFYPRLLAMGRIERKQYLLPVSFNIPALIFSKENENLVLSNQFTTDFDEIKKLSAPHNMQQYGAFTRIGFSPLWDNNFLLTAAVLSGASFRESGGETPRSVSSTPIAWEASALEQSMRFINNWTNEINSNSQADDDFTFKYFVEPKETLIKSRRILFSFIESDDLFILNEESKNHLDFRWIMDDNKLPVTDSSVYIGIPVKAKAKKAARAFIQWFFKIENQRRLLEYTRSIRINENIFGICGGFSALTSVTEQVYPVFYPELLGRMPPSENFTLLNILPSNWAIIKEQVVLPYLHDRARAVDVNPLEKRLTDWLRLNR